MDIKLVVRLPDEIIEEIKTEYNAKDDKDICKVIEVLFLSEMVASGSNIKLIKVEVDNEQHSNTTTDGIRSP